MKRTAWVGLLVLLILFVFETWGWCVKAEMLIFGEAVRAIWCARNGGDEINGLKSLEVILCVWQTSTFLYNHHDERVQLYSLRAHRRCTYALSYTLLGCGEENKTVVTLMSRGPLRSGESCA